MDEKTDAPQKPIVYVIGFTAALAGLFFGLDVGVISGALPLRTLPALADGVFMNAFANKGR